MRSFLFRFLFLSITAQASNAFGAHVAWDFATAHAVQPGVYARVRVLKDGRWALVSSHRRRVEISFSTDQGGTWSSPQQVARADGYDLTNSELLELSDGTLLYGYNARPLTPTGGTLPYGIMTTLSRDHGVTWSDSVAAFYAGNNFGDGCWEPAFLQLPSGEVQLYFANEGPYTHSEEQEISLLRSRDSGTTWSTPETVSFRRGHRDGMPVPVYLHPKNEIVVAIEDNGLDGNFKPVILRSKPGAVWGDRVISGESAQREATLNGLVSPAPHAYLGAPYLVQLPSGHTVLSVQSTIGRGEDSTSDSVAEVYVGDEAARHFGKGTRPFPGLAPRASANWNSLTPVGDRDVLLVSSMSPSVDEPSSEIWIIRGQVVDEGEGR